MTSGPATLWWPGRHRAPRRRDRPADAAPGGGPRPRRPPLRVRDLDGEREVSIGFDQVMLATGAAPVAPDWAVEAPKVHPVKTLDDGAIWKRLLAERPRRAVVVGGGYIGVEAAEAFARRGVRDHAGHPRRPADVGDPRTGHRPGRPVGPERPGRRRGHRDRGVRHRDGCRTAPWQAVCVGGAEFQADVVAVGIGCDAAGRAGRAERAAARRRRTSTAPWFPTTGSRWRTAYGPRATAPPSATDCWTAPWYVPLGTHANKCGRIAGTNIGGGSASLSRAWSAPRSPGPGEVELGRTGLLPDWAQQRLGLEVVDPSAGLDDHLRLHARRRTDERVGDGGRRDRAPARLPAGRWPGHREADRHRGHGAVHRPERGRRWPTSTCPTRRRSHPPGRRSRSPAAPWRSGSGTRLRPRQTQPPRRSGRGHQASTEEPP